MQCQLHHIAEFLTKLQYQPFVWQYCWQIPQSCNTLQRYSLFVRKLSSPGSRKT